jgi:hypothetical protein
MSSEFTIKAEISEDEWAKAARDRYDPDVEPLFDSLYGNVSIMASGQSLFGETPFRMSIADLAVQLAEILQSGFASDEAKALTASLRQNDDALELDFEIAGADVVVTHNVGIGTPIRVTRNAFRSGAAEFIREFVHQTVPRVPEALAWKDLRILKAFD